MGRPFKLCSNVQNRLMIEASTKRNRTRLIALLLIFAPS